MVDGRHVGVDVAGEFLAVELVGVDHREADRVRGGVTLADDGGIVAVKVIDGNVGKGAEGLEDESFAAVRELEVVIGDGVGGVHAHLKPLLDLRVDVGTDAEAIEVRANDRSFLIHVGAGDVVLDPLVTALGTQLMLVLERGAEHFVLPVGTDAEQRRIGIVCIGVRFAEFHEVVVELRPLAQVEHVDPDILLAHGHHSVIGDLRLAGLAVLGGDQDDAIGALGAVDGRRGCILEDFHADDIGRVEGGEGRNRGDLAVAQAAETVVPAGTAASLDDDTVDDVQRLGTRIDRGLTADADGGRGSRSTGGLHGGDTGSAALEGLVEVGDDGSLQVLLLHGDGGAGEVALLHGTVTHDDDFVEEFGILFQQDVDSGLVTHDHLLRCIADGREYERSSGPNRNRVVSIQVCDGTVPGAFFHDTDSHDAVTGIVRDGSDNPVLREQGSGGKECKRQG